MTAPLYTVLFTVSNALYLLNVGVLSRLSGGVSPGKKAAPIAVLQIVCSAVSGFCRSGGWGLAAASVSSFLGYLLIFVFALSHRHGGFKPLFFSAGFMATDSIIQSLTCITFGLFGSSADRTVVAKSASIVFGLAVFLVVRRLYETRGFMITTAIGTIPNRIFAMTVVALLLTGAMCGCMPVSFDEAQIKNNIINVSAALLIPVFLTVIVFLLVSSLSKSYYENASAMMEKQIRAQIEYYKKIDKLTQDIRSFRHDYRNHMICLQSLLESGRYGDAASYVGDITNREIVGAEKFFSGNPIADAILRDKSERASEVGCEIDFEGEISEYIPAADLCIILSNALDNAVEACAEIGSEQTPVVKVRCAALHGVQLIRISNPNPAELGSLKTTKSDKINHGFGLYNIRRAAERLGGKAEVETVFPEFVLTVEVRADEKDFCV